jgi:hypothetical protein
MRTRHGQKRKSPRFKPAEEPIVGCSEEGNRTAAIQENLVVGSMHLRMCMIRNGIDQPKNMFPLGRVEPVQQRCIRRPRLPRELQLRIPQNQLPLVTDAKLAPHLQHHLYFFAISNIFRLSSLRSH